MANNQRAIIKTLWVGRILVLKLTNKLAMMIAVAPIISQSKWGTSIKEAMPSQAKDTTGVA